ncbi:hypothetical protein LCGC14_2254660 [marine sediment metagenome]|uniref:PAS domain-containing protein n=1 Tax=marine sediment metagenome TaxID=412755 RepID=A0A0F9D1B2_9ZZZZ
MKTLVQILIISDNEAFVERVIELMDYPQIVVDNAETIPEDVRYDFYVLDGLTSVTESIDRIREFHEGAPIYLSGSICDEKIPIRKMCKCNVIACLEKDDDLRLFVKEVSSHCKQRVKTHEASCKLDYLKPGDLKILTRQLRKTESYKFIDYIQNHPLPMILVNREEEVIHANKAMEDMIGTKLPGISASTFWLDVDVFDNTVFDLKKEGQLLGREVTLKNIHGRPLLLKLYTSLHRDKQGNWLNTRCLFVPKCPECPLV